MGRCEKLSKGALLLYVLWSALAEAVVFVGLEIVFYKFLPEFLFLVPVICAVLAAVFLVFIFSEYKGFCCEWSKDCLVISRGVLIRRSRRVRLRFLVGAKLVASPLMRLLSLKVLVLVFEGSVCILPPMKKELVKEIYKNPDITEFT